MIEAVNSVLSTAPVARGAAELQSTARSFAANPDRVQEVIQAPYISPYIAMDLNYDKAVLQIRDSETGDVVRQIPSERQLEAYRRAQVAQDVNRQRTPEPQAQIQAQDQQIRFESAPQRPQRTQTRSAPAPQAQSSAPSVPAQTASADVISIDTQA